MIQHHINEFHFQGKEAELTRAKESDVEAASSATVCVDTPPSPIPKPAKEDVSKQSLPYAKYLLHILVEQLWLMIMTMYILLDKTFRKCTHYP